MSRKDVLSNFPMFGASGSSMATDQTTVGTNITYKDNIGIIVNWSGTTPIGQIFLDASNNQSTWVPLDFGSSITVSGNTGSHDINLNQFSFDYIRARYVATSGTGTIFMSLTVKQVGA